MAKKKTEFNSKKIIPFSLIFIFSLLLLFFIGKGEAQRSYSKFQFEKAIAIGEIVQKKINAYLNAGLPLSQYVGFKTLSRPLIQADEFITAMSVRNRRGKILFFSNKSGKKPIEKTEASRLSPNNNSYKITEAGSFLRLATSLSNKFQKTGELLIDIQTKKIDKAVNNAFSSFFIFFILAVLIFTTTTGYLFFKNAKRRKAFIKLTYGVCFFVMTAIIIINLIGLYSSGIQDKLKSTTKTIAHRLNSALELGLNLSDFTGIDKILRDYKKINPDIKFISLSRNNIALIHTDKNSTGKKLKHSPRYYEYRVPLSHSPNKSLIVTVSIPRNIIYKKMWQSVKNFFLLFMASGFLAFFFLNFIFSLQEKIKLEQKKATQRSINAFKLEMVRPLYFLTIFIEGLLISFLPQYFQKIAVASGLSANSASILFTAYFLAFVATLLPSGRYADRHGFKRLIQTGVLIYAISYFWMAIATNYMFVFTSRLLAGVGQGMLFIGVQSYILEAAHKTEKTQGTSIIVSGYNSGMISGTAIGALLAVYIGAANIFALAGITSILVFAYILFLLPEIEFKPHKNKKAEKTLREELKMIFKDSDFIKTILCVGMPTKAILTGINFFAIPLLLAANKFAQEDIGQVIVFYSIAVLISTGYISKITDRIGKTGRILFWGTQTGGMGLLLLSALGPSTSSVISAILGMIILGFAHGFIHAPIVTHIANTKTAHKLGIHSTVSVYRFLERIGHVMGPIIVGLLLVATNQSPFAIAIFGILVIILGLLFQLQKIRKAIFQESNGGKK